MKARRQGWRRRGCAMVAVLGVVTLPAMLAVPAFAADPVTTLLSKSAAGQPANTTSYLSGASDDGRIVTFWSTATNLVPDPNGSEAYFVDASGTLRLVAAATDGGRSNGNSSHPAVAGDGSAIAFASDATNLAPDDTNLVRDVFVRDAAGEVSMVSRATDGTPGSGWSFTPTISDDGRFVAFASDASNLVDGDTNASRDVFVHDRQSGTTTRVSVTSTGQQVASGSNGLPVISGDGRFVFFLSTSALVPGAPGGDAYHLYRHDRESGDTVHVDQREGGGFATSSVVTTPYAVSDDGRLATFPVEYADRWIPGRAADPAIMVRDLDAGTTQLASVLPDGSQAASAIHSDISSDGTRVSFAANQGVFVRHLGPQTSERVPAPATGGEHLLSDDARFLAFSGYAEGTYGVYRTDTDPPDTTAPSVTLTGTPAGLTSDDTPTFTFDVNDAEATAECSLSSARMDWAPCSSPYTPEPLPDGTHSFAVRATDAAGNVGATLTHAFTVDTQGPAVTLDEVPGPVSEDDTPTLAFSSEADATFDCSLTAGEATYSSCTSPMSYGPLAPDEYSFAVRATDGAGNTGPAATYTFAIQEAVDVPPPSVPDLVAASDTGWSSSDDITSDATPTFTGTAPAGTTVRILVDGALVGSQPVSSSGAYAVTASPLGRGFHAVTAVAIDGAGHASPATSPLTVEIVAATACHTATNAITGTAAADSLTGGRLTDRIRGLRGNDVIEGRGSGDCLVGGSGHDRLAGAAGADEMYGGDGNDRIALGGGADAGYGGAGNDRFFARDNAADVIDCGSGTADVATVDRGDQVVGCESTLIG